MIPRPAVAVSEFVANDDPVRDAGTVSDKHDAASILGPTLPASNGGLARVVASRADIVEEGNDRLFRGWVIELGRRQEVQEVVGQCGADCEAG